MENLTRVDIDSDGLVNLVAKNHQTSYRETFGGACVGTYEDFVEKVYDEIERYEVYVNADRTSHIIVENVTDDCVNMHTAYQIQKMYTVKHLRGQGVMRKMIYDLKAHLAAKLILMPKGYIEC